MRRYGFAVFVSTYTFCTHSTLPSPSYLMMKGQVYNSLKLSTFRLWTESKKK